MLLDFLPASAVQEYLAPRFPTQLETTLERVADSIHAHTDGNPLFMVAVVDYLTEQGRLSDSPQAWNWPNDAVDIGVPTTLQHMLQQQIESQEQMQQGLLEAASVVGRVFSTAAVAAGLDVAEAGIEDVCEQLARQGYLLERAGVTDWPDGTSTSQYRFAHALYQHVLRERIPPGRRRRLHTRIGERIERGYQGQTERVAAELAVHFESGGQPKQALHYRVQSAEHALSQFAYWEAAEHLTHALENLRQLPETQERLGDEFRLSMRLGTALLYSRGYASSEGLQAFTRAYELIPQLGDPAQIFYVLPALWTIHLIRGQFQQTHAITEQNLELAQKAQASLTLQWAHFGRGNVCLYSGEFIQSRQHYEQAISYAATLPDQRGQTGGKVSTPESDLSNVGGEVIAPKPGSTADLSVVLWILGCVDQARHRIDALVTQAHEEESITTLFYALGSDLFIARAERNIQAVLQKAESLVALATEYRAPHYLATGMVLQGWSLAQQGQAEEGIALIQQGITAHREAEAEIFLTYYYALLAEAYATAEQYAHSLDALAQAFTFVQKNGERYYEAELYRLKGELTQHESQDLNKAEEYFQLAISVARTQEAKSWQLRATLSLTRLWRRTRREQPPPLLHDIYSRFTEGFDTSDLTEAKASLDTLGT